MQLFALDEKKNRIFVERAENRKNYTCLECEQVVHRRGGLHVQPHFYHLHPQEKCKQSKKSKEHIAIQKALQEKLGTSSEQEVRFPAIDRIADVVCYERKLVFEVQCSPISKDEVKARIHDYTSVGYHVIWILYDKTFFKEKISLAEFFLQAYTHYFSDGKIFYDSLSYIRNGYRLGHFLKSPLEIATIAPLDHSKSHLPLEALRQRALLWRFSSKGDLLSLCETQNLQKEELAQANNFEGAFYIKNHPPLSIAQRLSSLCSYSIKNIYYTIIESCCH